MTETSTQPHLRAFVVAPDGRHANALVATLLRYLAARCKIELDIECAVVGQEHPQCGSAKVVRTLSEAFSLGWLPLKKEWDFANRDLMSQLEEIFRSASKCLSTPMDASALPHPREYDLCISVGPDHDGYETIISIDEAQVLAHAWGAVDEAFIRRVSQTLLALLLACDVKVAQLTQGDLESAPHSEDNPLPLATPAQPEGGHWSAHLDLGLTTDIEVLPQAHRDALRDLFAGKPDTSWYRWLCSCLTQGMMGRLPECAEMWADRQEDMEAHDG